MGRVGIGIKVRQLLTGQHIITEVREAAGLSTGCVSVRITRDGSRVTPSPALLGHSWSPEAPQQTRPSRWARSSSRSMAQTAPTAPQTTSRIFCLAQKVPRACSVLRRLFLLRADMARRSRQRCQCAHDRTRRAAKIHQSRARPSVGPTGAFGGQISRLRDKFRHHV